MKLIGTHRSPFLMRVLFCLRLKGVSVDIEPPVSDTNGAEFLKLNPLGKVPVLVDGDFVLPESVAICEYIQETCPGPSIWPAGAQARARARMIMQIIDLYLAPDMFNALLPDLAPGPIAGAKERLFTWMDAVESYLRDDDAWLVGDAPSLADACMATTLFYFEALGAKSGALGWIADRPLLAAWWARTKIDPMFAKILEEQYAALDPLVLAAA